MKELFDKALIALPAFLSRVLELLSGPKAFILQKDLTTPEAAIDAYTFLGVTLIIGLVAQLTFLPEQKDYLLTFSSIAVQATLSLILMVVILLFAWRIVGGTLSFKIFFIVSCYFSGISTLIFSCFALLASGWIKLFDPEHAARILHGSPAKDPMSFAYLGFALILFAGFIAVYVWIVVVWGAYRRLNDASRRRSAIALAVFTVLIPLMIVPQYLMGGNLIPSQESPATAAGDLPLEMIGLWKAGFTEGGNSVPSDEAATYDFFPNGEYFRIRKSTARQGACRIVTLDNASGYARVDGSMLVLVPLKRIKTVANGCTTEKVETPLDLDKEIYPFEIRHQPAG